MWLSAIVPKSYRASYGKKLIFLDFRWRCKFPKNIFDFIMSALSFSLDDMWDYDMEFGKNVGCQNVYTRTSHVHTMYFQWTSIVRKSLKSTGDTEDANLNIQYASLKKAQSMYLYIRTHFGQKQYSHLFPKKKGSWHSLTLFTSIYRISKISREWINKQWFKIHWC